MTKEDPGREIFLHGSLDRRTFIGHALSLAAGSAIFPLTAFAVAPADPWVYAAELERRISVPEFPGRDFQVTDFGAVGDGETDCTDSLNEAIRACSEAGGGRVVVPEGVYRTGPIHLLSNVNFHVSDGATLSFYTDPARYLPVVFTRFEGTVLMNF